MKVLLFFSGQSSLSHIFKQVFKLKTDDVEVVNYLDFLPSFYHRLHNKSGKMPRSVEQQIRKNYLSKIQEKYIEVINNKKPDLIFVYNDQMLCAETLDKVSNKIKTSVFLADSPLFLQKRPHIIGLIRRVDVVFAPDTYWLDQCKMLGVKRTEYLIPGFNEKHNYKIIPASSQYKKYNSDVFFMGSPYPENWGYKRALFLSKFSQFKFILLGPDSWRNWFGDFPELESHFKSKKGHLSDEDLNIMMNCSKIIPIDANPGIINGFHIRVFDTIASGVLPLIEYRKDLEGIFKSTDIMFIKDYNQIPELVNYYLNNEELRISLIKQLQNSVLNKYGNDQSADIIFNSLKLI